MSDQSQFITLCAVCVWAGLRCVYYNHTHKRDTAQIHAHAHAPTHFRGTAANWQERHMRGPDSESAIKIARYRKSSSEEKSSSHVWSNSRFFPQSRLYKHTHTHTHTQSKVCATYKLAKGEKSLNERRFLYEQKAKKIGKRCIIREFFDASSR